MRRMPFLPVFALAAGLVAVCGPTKMLKTWKSPDYQNGTLRKSLIIAIFKTTGVRETVEDQFVAQLQAERLEAVASHASLPDDELNREAVVKKVQELGFDGVVLARIIDGKMYETYGAPGKEKVDVPVGYYDEWYKSYVESTAQRDAVGYTDASRMDAWVETRVFDARTQKLVWTGVSETQIDGRDPRQIQDAITAILNSMRRDGMY